LTSKTRALVTFSLVALAGVTVAARGEADAPPSPPAPPPGPAACTPVSAEALSSVLLIGDSSVGFHDGLSRGMELQMKPRGATFSAEPYSSYGIQAFANLDKWQTVMKQRKPKLVIVSLGMNNVYSAKPQELASSIKAIVAKIAPAECVWLAPPIWKGENGLLDVLKKNTAPCRYFDSNKLKIERGSDKIHPSNRGAEVWAEAVMKYLTQCVEPGAAPPPSP
jgi:hypothetical protein